MANHEFTLSTLNNLFLPHGYSAAVCVHACMFVNSCACVCVCVCIIEKMGSVKVFTIKRCSVIRGVHYERFHCIYLFIPVHKQVLHACTAIHID